MLFFVLLCTVKPVLSDHPTVRAKVVFIDRWSLKPGSPFPPDNTAPQLHVWHSNVNFEEQPFAISDKERRAERLSFEIIIIL